MTYSEQSSQIALECPLVVLVLMGAAPGDAEFLPIRPKAFDENMRADLKARWPGRGLRSVGLVGLSSDMKPICAFKEPLEPEQVSALAGAFLAYIHVLFCDSFTAQVEAAEIQELGRLMSLPDNRVN